MKMIALIMLLVFGLVQAGPAICSVFSETTSILVIDEEKGEEKTEAEKKKKKDLFESDNFNWELTRVFQNTIPRSEELHLSPFREKLTPPPNFC